MIWLMNLHGNGVAKTLREIAKKSWSTQTMYSVQLYDVYILHLLHIVQCNGVIYPVLMALIHGEPEPESF